MKVIATYNIKGGVGKTAAAVNLAYLSAKEGAPTLLWDLDPQAASTFYFRVRAKVKGGAKGLVAGKRELDDLIKGSDYDNLDILPADFSFRNLDLVLDQSKKPSGRLKKLLKPLDGEYERIFLDCPPSISLFSECVFQAADAVVSPVIPTTLSLRTLEQLEAFIENNALRDLKLLPFFSMVDRRKQMHRRIMESLPERCPNLLKAVIPMASDVERMGIERAPLDCFAQRSRAARAYEALWAEIRLCLEA